MCDVFISIIVPIYNVERFIDACVESLFRDVQPDIEYIFVDDCSPDQSIQHIRDQAQKYNIPNNQIHFLKNEHNCGLSVTRNNGEAAASGKYIWFVDSDDWIKDGILPRLIDFLKKNQPEILALPVIHTDAGTCSSEYTPYLKRFSGEFEGKKLLHHILPCAQFYIFDHTFWRDNHFTFYPGIYHEDVELTPKVRYLAKRVMAFPETVYFYRITEGSIVTTPKIKRSEDLLIVAQRLTDFMNTKVSQEDRILFADIIAVVLTNCLNNASYLLKDERKRFANDLNKEKHLFAICSICSNIKHRVLFVFRYVSPRILLFFYCVWSRRKQKSIQEMKRRNR